MKVEERRGVPEGTVNPFIDWLLDETNQKDSPGAPGFPPNSVVGSAARQAPPQVKGRCRTCRIPASGSSRESFAHSGVAMDNLGCCQRVAREESGELSPFGNGTVRASTDQSAR
jgi:hypothetical protein